MLVFVSVNNTAFGSQNIKVIINDHQRYFTPSPIIQDGSTLVPMRMFFEALGAKVQWDSTSKTVIGMRNSNVIKLTINQNTAFINDNIVSLSVPGKIINGNTYIPLRFVGEALGDSVTWNTHSSTITIITSGSLINSSYNGEVKIGIMLPISGGVANNGEDMKNAINLAVNQINAKGGILGKKIITVTADDACDAEQSITAANKLITQGVVAVVGGYCVSATIPTLGLYNDAKIPFVIAASDSSRIKDENPGNAFQINSIIENNITKTIEIWEKENVKNVVIFTYDNNSWLEDLANSLKAEWELLGNVAAVQKLTFDGNKIVTPSIMDLIKEVNPDLVYWGGYNRECSILADQLRQIGYSSKIMAWEGSYLDSAPFKKMEGVQVLTVPIPQYLPTAKHFVKDYYSYYEVKPGDYSALAYDSMEILADAITRANSTDFDPLIKALCDTDYQGITGPTSFTTENTRMESNYILLEVKNGGFALVQ